MKAWAVKTPRGRIDEDTISKTREGAMYKLCVWQYGRSPNYIAIKLKAEGFRAVRVEVTEVVECGME